MTCKSLATETQAHHRQAEQLLRHLNTPGNTALICSSNRNQIILTSSHSKVSLSRGTLPIDTAQLLVARHYIEATSQRTFIITDAGRAALHENSDHSESTKKLPKKAHQVRTMSRMPTSTIHVPMETQMAKPRSPKDIIERQAHRAIRTTNIHDGNETIAVQFNDAESPLAWLHRRRDRNGEPFIDDTCFEAGERLRRDITLAQVMPQVTSNWSPTRGSGSAGGPAIATDTMVSARQRLHQALDAVDGNYAGILLDVCGFLKGIEEIERERQWPPRSGKVVLKLALQRLATHYGLNREARGPAYSRGIRHWTAL